MRRAHDGIETASQALNQQWPHDAVKIGYVCSLVAFWLQHSVQESAGRSTLPYVEARAGTVGVLTALPKLGKWAVSNMLIVQHVFGMSKTQPAN